MHFKRRVTSFLILALIVIFFGKTEIEAKLPTSSGLPIPRFASLRSSDINLRTGPGTRYPISWVIKKRLLPVKVIAEHDNWRKIQLHDDTVGWVFQSMLTGNKTVMILTDRANLRRAPSENSSIMATMAQDVIGQLKTCKGSWCKIGFEKYVGWVEKSSLWGAEYNQK